MSILDRLTTLFAPDDCLGCGREGALLCSVCLMELPTVKGRCFGCHRPVAGSACRGCLQTAALDRLRVAADYAGAAKNVVAGLKFQGNQSAARLMALRLHQIADLPPGALLVHVPATTAHIRQRGFDQSQLVARHVGRLTGLPTAAMLRRHGQQHQLGADRQQRFKQLAATVTVRRPAQVRGRHIILIDDVLTTGSSLTIAARALRQAGATRVEALVFAQSVA